MSSKIEKTEQKHLAELSFSYTTIDNHPSLLIIGNLDITNTGEVMLSNPIIRLTFTPVYNISIRGQLIPEKMIKTLSVYNDDGPTGWSFKNKNNIEENTGTMWIKSIGDIAIAPNERITIPNLQFHIMWAPDVHFAQFQIETTFDEADGSTETLTLRFENNSIHKE